MPLSLVFNLFTATVNDCMGIFRLCNIALKLDATMCTFLLVPCGFMLQETVALNMRKNPLLLYTNKNWIANTNRGANTDLCCLLDYILLPKVRN